jgi:cation:H+ antiporter
MLFLFCAVIIGVSGTVLSGVADRLADRGGLGEALTGSVLLGAVTSLSGSVLSVSAALADQPVLALSNAYGGIAVQTLFLALADASYRRANLEHAAASAENVLQSALLVCLLATLLAASYSPDWTLFGIHPATPVLLAGYAFGIRLVQRSRHAPMWRPRRTAETRLDTPDQANLRRSLAGLVIAFAVLGAIMGGSGWLMQRVASALVASTGVDASIIGSLLTAFATSLPELVTTLAAVRRGALTLAVSGIMGGNAYDTLFAAFSDVAYRSGSIYHAADPALQFWLATSILMAGVLIMGMIVREQRGPANMGFESVAVVALYLSAVLVLFSQRL